MDADWEGEVVHEGWLTKSPPLEPKTKQIFSQTLLQPVSHNFHVSSFHEIIIMKHKHKLQPCVVLQLLE